MTEEELREPELGVSWERREGPECPQGRGVQGSPEKCRRRPHGSEGAPMRKTYRCPPGRGVNASSCGGWGVLELGSNEIRCKLWKDHVSRYLESSMHRVVE